jgi:TolA-binding protein
MKKVCILLTALFFLAYTCFAKELFISTDPINADVYIGDALIGRSPLRIGSVDVDTAQTLRIVKPGYEDIEFTLELDEARTQLIFHTLYSPNVDFILSQREKEVFLNEVDAGKSPLVVQNVPNGIYRIDSDQNRITISNAEYARLKKTTRWEAISSSVLFAGSLGGAIYFRNNDQEKVADLLVLSTFIFGGLLGYNLLKLGKINLDERRDRAEMSAIEISHKSVEEDRDMFAGAMEYVGKEYYEDALSKFKLLVNLYPDSQYVPLSLFQIGQIYYGSEEYGRAAGSFKSFVYDYPKLELFAFAVHKLIDAELQSGNTSQALGHYESLRPIYIDDPSGTLYGSYYDLFTKLFEENGRRDEQILIDLLTELDYFLDRYGDTYFYPEVLYLKGQLLYTYLDRDAGVAVFDTLKENFSQREEILSKVERTLNAR